VFIFIFVFFLAVGIARLCKASDEETRSSRTHTTYRRASSRRPRVTRERILPPSIILHSDQASSPIGGSCLRCDAVITDETSLHCQNCGTEHQRCPICHRFVTANQELLACPHCKTLGHTNEMQRWVQKSNKCPHCGKEVMVHQLQPWR
jgi:DNA-directed RNA polymerase subunit RPC12/RpoP